MDLQVYALEQGSIFYTNKRKLHIYDWDSGRCLCGCQAAGNCTLQQVDKEWLSQPDPDNIVCKSCRKIANKIKDMTNKAKQGKDEHKHISTVNDYDGLANYSSGNNHGGRRPGAGKPKIEGGVRHYWTVPADVDAIVKEHGTKWLWEAARCQAAVEHICAQSRSGV